MSGVGVSGMHGAGWGGEIGLCGMRMQTMRTWFIMADAEVAENVGFWRWRCNKVAIFLRYSIASESSERFMPLFPFTLRLHA